MRGRVLIVETYARRRIIAVAHGTFFLVYALSFVWPYPGMLVLGGVLFVCAGIVLPLLLSIGIFGDDIASGRSVPPCVPILPRWEFRRHASSCYHPLPCDSLTGTGVFHSGTSSSSQ